MKNTESTRFLNEGAKRAIWPEIYLALGLLGLIATFLAHLGNHLEIHLEIANVAMLAESVCAGTSLAAIFKRNNNIEEYIILSRVAAASLLIAAGCVAAVPLTDSGQYSEFLLSGRALNPDSWGKLATCWKNDAERELFYGVQYVGRWPTDPDPNLRPCTPADLNSP